MKLYTFSARMLMLPIIVVIASIILSCGSSSSFQLKPLYTPTYILIEYKGTPSPSVMPKVIPSETIMVRPTATHTVMQIQTGYPEGLLNFRAGPGEEYHILRVFKEGDKVEVLYRIGDWYAVKYEGLVGYLYAEFIKEIK